MLREQGVTEFEDPTSGLKLKLGVPPGPVSEKPLDIELRPKRKSMFDLICDPEFERNFPSPEALDRHVDSLKPQPAKDNK